MRILVFLLVMPLIGYAQTIRVSFDNELARTSFGEIVPTSDGGYIAAGVGQPEGFDSSIALVAKFSESLEVEWSKYFRTLRDDDFAGLIPTADGNFLVYGTVRQDFTLVCGGSLMKIDPAGNLLWSKIYDDSCDDRIVEVHENTDGSLHLFIRKGVTGRGTKIVKTNSFGDILDQQLYSRVSDGEEIKIDAAIRVPGGDFYLTGGLREGLDLPFFVMRYNGSSVVWAKTYSLGRTFHTPSGIAVLDNGNIAISAFIDDSLATTQVNQYVAQIDPSGAVIQSTEIDVGGFDALSDIVGASNGDILVVGSSLESFRTAQIYRLDDVGSVLWTKTFSIPDTSVSYSDIFELPDNRIFVDGGYSVGFASSVPLFSILDTQGEVDCYGGDTVFTVSSPTVTSANLVVSAENPGLTVEDLPVIERDYSITPNVWCSDSLSSVGITSIQQSQTLVYPNPASQRVQIINAESEVHQFAVYSSDGKQVTVENLQKGYSLIDVSNWAEGIYFIPELRAKFVVSR